MKRFEYRIIWDDDGYGNVFPGNWAPLEWPFDHQREACKHAGKEWDGHGKIEVSQARVVEFRMVP